MGLHMKTFFEISVYVQTDKLGQQWDTVGENGRLDRFKPGTSQFNSPKRFDSKDKAYRYAQQTSFLVYNIVQFDPPISPSINWRKKIVLEIGSPC